MKIIIKNVEIFEWEVPDELVDIARKDAQAIIDEYFDPEDISVCHISDSYYEYVEEAD